MEDPPGSRAIEQGKRNSQILVGLRYVNSKFQSVLLYDLSLIHTK